MNNGHDTVQGRRHDRSADSTVPDDSGKMTGRAEEFEQASQWRLIWWRFTRHRLAVVSGVVIILLYAVAIFADFLTPYPPNKRLGQPLAAPQLPVFVTEGGVRFPPVVYGLNGDIDPQTFRRIYVADTSVTYRIRFFVRREPYKLLGVVPTDVRLFGVEEGGTIYLFGTDRLGRDLFTRVIHGARISLSIGLIGVAMSLFLGILIGGVSGYLGGVVDTIVQRLIEVLFSFPTIPLWMALAAALPRNWGPIQVYFGITVILSIVGWTRLARVVRGRFLALREEDFVLAAALCGAGKGRIIFRHILPSFTSHIIAAVTIAIPSMILAETSLSFLGIGLMSPVVSWGVLLRDAQNIHSLVMAPWLFFPVPFVVVTVLAFNFLGDGLRDAADPYSEVT